MSGETRTPVTDVQMAVKAPYPLCWITSVKRFTVVKADAAGTLGIWVTPGWYRRVNEPNGSIHLLPMRRWRLWRHRLLWGFSGLVDAR